MGAATIATSTEARALKKAGVDRSEGSEQRWQQEFVGRGRSGLGRFESFSPTSDDHTRANLYWTVRRSWEWKGDDAGYLGNVDSGESCEEGILPRFMYGPSVGEQGGITLLAKRGVLRPWH